MLEVPARSVPGSHPGGRQYARPPRSGPRTDGLDARVTHPSVLGIQKLYRERQESNNQLIGENSRVSKLLWACEPRLSILLTITASLYLRYMNRGLLVGALDSIDARELILCDEGEDTRLATVHVTIFLACSRMGLAYERRPPRCSCPAYSGATLK